MTKILKIEIDVCGPACEACCPYLDEASIDSPFGDPNPQRCRLFDSWLGDGTRFRETLRCEQCLHAEEVI